MINLSKKDLPTTIEVEGRSFSLKTDFRKWIFFDEMVRDNDTEGLRDLISNKPSYLTDDIVVALYRFYMNPNSCPHDTESSGDNAYDFREDGELIYAAFIQQYGIDLIEVDYMHWHKFKALFNGLTSNTRMGEVENFRCYKGTEKEYLKIKNQWSLPLVLTEEEQKQIDEFNDYFGG